MFWCKRCNCSIIFFQNICKCAIPLLLILLLAWITSACGNGNKQEQKLIITSSSTIAPIMTEVAKRYESQHVNVRIDVQSGGSARGIADVRQQLADIGMVSRDAQAQENDLNWFAIARDGVAMIVHRTNPLEDLSDEQIVAIYTGKISNWSGLNHLDLPITVVNKAEGRSTLEVFLHHFHLQNSAIKAQAVIGDNQQGIKTVAANPGAIGYVSIGSAQYEARSGTPIKLLPARGVAATVENVRSGSFPLSRTLHLITKTKPQGLVKAFLEFAQSHQAADLIEAQYFVPLSH